MTGSFFRASALATLAAAILACAPRSPALAAGLTAGTDFDRLGREARARAVPVLVLFSRSGCEWCERVRREYLAPMSQDAVWRERVVIRQVDADSDRPMVDFAGRATTHRAFAERERGTFTPTVVVFGPAGEHLAEPIVGLRTPDFYGAYLERAIEEGRDRLRATPSRR